MTPTLTFINGFLFALSSSLAASIVLKVTVTLALGHIALRLARRSRAALRHALLAAIFGVLLLLPIVSMVAPAVRISLSVPTPVPLSAGDQERIAPAFAADVTPSALPGRSGEAVASIVTTVVTPGFPKSTGLSTSAVLLAIWIAGTALFLLRMAIGLSQVRRLCRSAVPWPHGQPVLETLARDAGIHRRVDVLLHAALPGPMTCGVVHPAIVLPEDAPTWDHDDRNRAIMHELEHVRRADWLSHCLARAVCTAYWFHPLVWIAWRRFALEAERSCDDAVLGRSEATAYADQLVGLAQRISLASRATAQATTAKSPLLAMANRADLARRVGALLDTRQRRGRAGILSVSLASAAAAVLVLTVSPLRMVAAPQSAITDVSVTPTPAPVAIAAAPQAVTTRVAKPANAQVPVAQTPTPVAISAVPQSPTLPIRVAPTPTPAPVVIAAVPQAPTAPIPVAPMLAPLALAVEPQAGTNVSAPIARFFSRTMLVIVSASVYDKSGKPIEGLSANDFAVTEDGVPQRIMVLEFQKVAQTIGVQSSLSSYYILGYYATNSNLDGKDRQIEITRKNDAIAKLDYRHGYHATSPNVAGGDAQQDADRSTALDRTQPVLMTKIEPAYSEEARKAKWQGTVRLDVVVDEHGVPIDVTIRRALGLGLDQKAMEAVWLWRFKPATKDGKPVTAQVQVDMEFRLF
jgi:TonB family protein